MGSCIVLSKCSQLSLWLLPFFPSGGYSYPRQGPSLSGENRGPSITRTLTSLKWPISSHTWVI